MWLDPFTTKIPSPPPFSRGASQTENETPKRTTIPVLYIGGVGRSGSTLVERWVGESLSLATPGELDSLWAQGIISNESCGCGKAFADCEFWLQVGERAFGGWTLELAEETIQLQDKYCRLRRLPKLAISLRRTTFSPELSLLVERNYSLLEAIQHVSNCDGVVDASKQFPRLLLLNRDPRLICVPLHLVRHRQAVARSWEKPKIRLHSGTTETEMPKRNALSVGVEWLAVNVLFAVQTWRAQKAARLRFEDFLEHPELAIDWLEGWVSRREGAVKNSAGELVLTKAHGMGGNSARFAQGPVRLLKGLGHN